MRIKINQVDEMDEYLEARKSKEEAERRFRLAESKLLATMAGEATKTKHKTDGGKTYQVTYVQSFRTKIDEDGLKKALGAVKFRKYCDLKLNNKKVEEGLNNGEIDKDTLAKLVEETPSKPFIRFTEGVADDDHASGGE